MLSGSRNHQKKCQKSLCGLSDMCAAPTTRIMAAADATSSGPAAAAAEPSAATPAPQLRFGAIADVQFADVDDAWNFKRTQRRGYRGALECLRRAVDDWDSGPELSFVADLGDIIDQQCEAMGDSRRALKLVLDEYARLRTKVEHMVGNHELYNFSRRECKELIPNITPWFRSWQPVDGWRMIVLDPYDLNAIERNGGQAVEEGLVYLGKHNPNDLRAPRGSVDLSQGLNGLQHRFLPMGGAFKDEQLSWLRGELSAAEESRERVIVLTHLPVLPEATVPGGLTWNYDAVLEVLQGARPGTVALVLAGHYHMGKYSWDKERGTHHVTLPSPLHAEADDPRAHCVIEAFEDRVEILGRGLVPSRTLQLLPLSLEAAAPPRDGTSRPSLAERGGLASRL